MSRTTDAFGGFAMFYRVKLTLYGLLSILGAVLTWSNNLAWMRTAETPSLSLFWTTAFSTHVGASVSWDLVILATAGLVFATAETWRIGLSRWWPVAVFVLGNGIAIAFVFPLFLLFRERRLQVLAVGDGPSASDGRR